MIEPVYMHVWFVHVFVCTEGRETYVFTMVGRHPRGSFLYVFQVPHFKWIFGVCCFTTYPGCERNIDFALLSLGYRLICVLVTLNQQNEAHWCWALQFCSLDIIGGKTWLCRRRPDNKMTTVSINQTAKDTGRPQVRETDSQALSQASR